MAEHIKQRLTTPQIRARKGGPHLVMVTAYDYLIARLAESAGIDLLLVGDTLGMAVLGYDSTVPVTMDDILHHCQAVVRGAPNTHVIADLPFMSYQVSDTQAVENAGRLIKEGGADAVKLEGGCAMARQIEAITAAGIPVMGHVGLTPQSVGSLGGWKVQGRHLESAQAIVADAEAVADAGAYALVIEAVPANLGVLITERIQIPTIGIGAGVGCDGQVLVSTDLLGLEDRINPRFVKTYAHLGATIRTAFAAYAEEVRNGTFPDREHSYAMKPDVAAALRTTPSKAVR